MAKVVQPDEFVTQGRGESVVYEFLWPDWDADLKGARVAKFTLKVIRGTPVALTVLDDERGYKKSRLGVRASSQAGQCQITRTVETVQHPKERRIRTFTVLVE